MEDHIQAQGEDAISKSRSEASEATLPADTLISDFQPPES